MIQLTELRNRYQGEPILVAGLGPSVREFEKPQGLFTIGVNDIERHLVPDMLVLVDPVYRFLPGRKDWLNNSSARWIVSQLEPERFPEKEILPPELPGRQHVRMTLGGDMGATDLDACQPPHGFTSVIPAIGVAAILGAPRIGVIGFDLVFEDPALSEWVHPLYHHVNQIRRLTAKVVADLAAQQVEVGNLSWISNVGSLPRRTVSWLLGCEVPKEEAS